MHGNYFRCVWAFCASKRRVNYATVSTSKVWRLSFNSQWVRHMCADLVPADIVWGLPGTFSAFCTNDRPHYNSHLHICLSRNVNSFENIENAAMTSSSPLTANQYRQREICRTQKVLSNPFNRRTTKRNDDRKKPVFIFSSWETAHKQLNDSYEIINQSVASWRPKVHSDRFSLRILHMKIQWRRKCCWERRHERKVRINSPAATANYYLWRWRRIDRMNCIHIIN